MAEWIWYPGDYECKIYNETVLSRFERDVFVIPYTQFRSTTQFVIFWKECELTKTNKFFVNSTGKCNLQVSYFDKGFSRYIYGLKDNFELPKGKYLLLFQVFCVGNEFPCLYVEGEEIQSDSSWICSLDNCEYLPVSYRGFNNKDVKPSIYTLPIRKINNYSIIENNGQKVYAFPKEIVAFIKFLGIKGKGEINVYYGESIEEATDFNNCETLDYLVVENDIKELETLIAKAFKYIVIETNGITFDTLEVLEEFRPHANEPRFVCDNDLINKIWNTSLYTFDLTSRKLFIDGVKRDRWVWGGDAYQSILMNWYSFYDTQIAKDTLSSILYYVNGTFTSHINKINAYSFYVLIAVYEYYNHTKDIEYVKYLYPQIKKLIDFCISRLDSNGLMQRKKGDWMFVDWSEGCTSEGYLAYIQMLLSEALKDVSILSDVIDKKEDNVLYNNLYTKVLDKIKHDFWDEENGCFINAIVNGEKDRTIFRQANSIAILYNIADESQKQKILKNVLLNDNVYKISTPFFRFFEYSALASMGEIQKTIENIKEYWGAMIDEGATTFWEVYDKKEVDKQKYSMYGRKYGKSLCHAWGATPLYILGKYIVGLDEQTDFCELTINKFIGLNDIKYSVPLYKGFFEFYRKDNFINIKSIGKDIRLKFKGFDELTNLLLDGQPVDLTEITIEKNKDHIIVLGDS